MEEQIVWVLVIDHRYGQDVSVFRTEKSALAALYSYVKEWWEDMVDDEMRNDMTPDEAIETYFEEAAKLGNGRGEFYLLERRALED